MADRKTWELVPQNAILFFMKTPIPNEPPKVLIAAVTRLLRPLVRLMLHFQITYPYLCQVLKALYVDVASKDFPADNARQTDSRITLLTGVHRKDVRSFREAGLEALRPPDTLPVGAQIVAAWLGAPGYQTRQGAPKPLPRTQTETTDGVSFETLVESVTRGDLRARSVLDEWLRSGLVAINEKAQVCLNVEAFIPEKGFDEKVYYFGKNLHDHVAAGVHNLLGNDTPHFDRSVYYNHLTPASMDELNDLIQARGSDVLKDINKRARELQRQDAGNAEALQRFNFGMYYFLEKQPAQEQSEENRE